MFLFIFSIWLIHNEVSWGWQPFASLFSKGGNRVVCEKLRNIFVQNLLRLIDSVTVCLQSMAAKVRESPESRNNYRLQKWIMWFEIKLTESDSLMSGSTLMATGSSETGRYEVICPTCDFTSTVPNGSRRTICPKCGGFYRREDAERPEPRRLAQRSVIILCIYFFPSG